MKPFISRNLIQPALFSIRREPVLRLLPELEKEQFFSLDHIIARQIEHLQPLVSHALLMHPAYRKLIDEKGLSSMDFRDLSDLKQLPVLEKQNLRVFYNELIKNGQTVGPNTVRKTGGSSGEPCVVIADRNASGYSLAARALCQSWYGIRLGDRQIRFWGRPLASGHFQSTVKDLILNRIRMDSLSLSPASISKTLNRIRSFGADYFYGYTSLIQLLADNWPESSLQSFRGLKAIISTSETILPTQQEFLASFFDCPVANEYGCSEVDIIAFSCPEGGQHVMSSNLIVEVIRFGGEPEGYGQIVVTDLQNFLMPIIRYRVGDLVPLDMTSCGCGRGWPCLGPVLGRSQGQYISLEDGQRVHSQFVVYMLEELMMGGVPIGRFKIIQERKDLLRIQVSHANGEKLDIERILVFCRVQGQPVFGNQITWEVMEVNSEDLEKSRVNKYQHFESKIDR